MNLSPLPIQKFFSNNGEPLVAGLLFTYEAGTSNKIATYTDSSGLSLNTNPIVLDYRGECRVWLDPELTYKFVLSAKGDTDPPTNPIWSVDDISAGVTIADLTQQFLGKILFPQTAAEAAVPVVPSNYAQLPGDSRRLSIDATGGTDVTAKIQQLLDEAGKAALNGDVREVILQPGTYMVTRLYMQYSNVWLRLMPGAVIKQTLTGIVNNRTNGQPPAYAIIHINPLTYTNNPVAPVTAITNVCIYGGGTVQGPYTTTQAYNSFVLGIVSNDCHSCWVEDITMLGCAGENILLNPSAWNTCNDLRIIGCDVSQGGETGINNARDYLVLSNFVHDSWSQNGLGGSGDGGLVCFNRVRSMSGNGISIGGSGAKDVNACRNVIVGFNEVLNTNLTSGGGPAISLIDDGATTTPKLGIKVIGNTCNLNQSGTGAVIVGDYATASSYVDIEHNFIIAGNSGVSTAGIAITNGSARYNLRDNSFAIGVGNMSVCMDILGGTPVVNIWSFDNKDVATDIQHVSLFNIIDCQRVLAPQLTLLGCTTSPATTAHVVKRGKSYIMQIDGVTATSNATTSGLSGLPQELWPARTLNFRFPVVDNGTSLDGILQITAAGAINLFSSIVGAGFTAAGTKGLTGPYSVPVQMT